MKKTNIPGEEAGKSPLTIEERLERIEMLLTLSTKEVLDIDEAACYLGLSKSRTYHLLKDRELPHYKNASGKVSFKKTELDEWKLGRKVKCKAEIEAEAISYISKKHCGIA